VCRVSLPGTTDTNGGVLKPPIRGGTESIASRWTRSDSIDGERLSDCRAPVVSGNREALDSQRIEQRVQEFPDCPCAPCLTIRSVWLRSRAKRAQSSGGRLHCVPGRWHLTLLHRLANREVVGRLTPFADLDRDTRLRVASSLTSAYVFLRCLVLLKIVRDCLDDLVDASRRDIQMKKKAGQRCNGRPHSASIEFALQCSTMLGRNANKDHVGGNAFNAKRRDLRQSSPSCCALR
jgi:hypothetical protein